MKIVETHDFIFEENILKMKVKGNKIQFLAENSPAQCKV